MPSFAIITNSYTIKLGVSVKGSYAGYSEPDPDERDIAAYETILSGDLGGNDVEVGDPCDLLNEPTRLENSYHVVTATNIDETDVLDGFTITAGNADGPDFETCGGAGMFNNGHDNPCNPTVTGCTFIDNSAGEFGGAIFNYGHGDGEANPILTDCKFIRNASGQEGGGICNWQARPVVTNCTFTRNFAGNGAGIDNIGASPVLTNCTFTENSAAYAGGAIWNYEASPLVIGCIFTGNSADVGGAIQNFNSSSPTLTNCKFIGNTANNDGGAMCNTDPSSSTLTNCLFTGNSAGEEGGAIFNDRNSDPILTNCTLSRNSAQSTGGGMHNHFDTSPTLTNCILWGNDDSGGVDESAQIYGGTVVVAYSCIQGLDTFIGNNNIAANPLFRDDDGPDNVLGTSDDNLRLMAASPCIDRADNAAIPIDVETDLAGHPRILDGDCDYRYIVDMGAYEFSYAYIGDFDYDCDVDFADFAVLAPAWLTEPGDAQWNPTCDIGIPNDTAVNMLDLQLFVENWLTGDQR